MYNVLIVEDEKETGKSVQDALELNEINSELAIDGEEAIEKFNNGNYDLILLDLKLPKISGEEVLQEIRKKDPFIDIIIYSNFHEFKRIKDLTNMGIDGYINKGPEADLQKLIDVIKKKLEPMDENELGILLTKTGKDIIA